MKSDRFRKVLVRGIIARKDNISPLYVDGVMEELQKQANVCGKDNSTFGLLRKTLCQELLPEV